MKLPYRESFAYYASCMILFNVIYLALMLSKGVLCPNHINWKSFTYVCDFITFCLSGCFTLIGIMVTFWICKKKDIKKNISTQGTQVCVIEMHDDTIGNFFSNFSLLVLTGLSLPVREGIFSLIIFLLIFISLGLVYTDNNLIYINPLLSLMHYNVYHCKCILTNKNNQLREFCFFKQGNAPEINRPFSFQNVGVDRKIIRLNKEIKYDDEEKS